jgi:hypothetical protein
VKISNFKLYFRKKKKEEEEVHRPFIYKNQKSTGIYESRISFEFGQFFVFFVIFSVIWRNLIF